MMTRRSFFATGSLAMLGAGCVSAKKTADCTCGSSCTCAPCECGGEIAKRTRRPKDLYTFGKVPFHLGMAQYTLHKYDVDATFDILKKLDVKYLCIKYHLVGGKLNGKDGYTADRVNAITDAQIAAFKKRCADAGIVMSAMGPVYMETEAECEAAFRFAQRMGLKVLVAVPFEFVTGANGKKERVASRKLCEFADKCCKKYDIKYAIHNHGPDSPKYFPTGKSAFDLVKDLDPRMGLCLDIGHDFRFGMDPADSIRKMHARIFDIHLKNVCVDTLKNKAMPLSRGEIDLYDVVKALKEANYTGCCSLEFEDFKDSNCGFEANLAECIGYFRALMDSVR